jgi:hypothetical protein
MPYRFLSGQVTTRCEAFTGIAGPDLVIHLDHAPLGQSGALRVNIGHYLPTPLRPQSRWAGLRDCDDRTVRDSPVRSEVPDPDDEPLVNDFRPDLRFEILQPSRETLRDHLLLPRFIGLIGGGTFTMKSSWLMTVTS